ncbi:TPR and ankyrin repeat-containing protein 1-like, partial [Elysia marginata]
PLAKQTGDDPAAMLQRNFKPVPGNIRLHLAAEFIQNHTSESWKKAEFVFGLNGDSAPVSRKEDLRIFCKRDLLNRNGWVCSFILQLANLRDLIPTLKFHPQDHYLHAALTLVVSTGSSPAKHPDTVVLLEKVIDLAKTRQELNRQDADGNTALHWLTLCKGPCEPMRQEAARLLIEGGIDVLMPRKDGRKAADVLNVSDSIRDQVKSATDQAIAIERNKLFSRSGGASAQPQQSAKASRAQQTSTSQTKPPRTNNKTAAPPVNNSRPDASKNASGERKECDECERYLQNANSWTPRNLGNIYRDLVKIVKANHKQDGRHRIYRDESIKRISKFLHLKDVPDIPQCVLDLKAVDYRELVTLAAEAKKWGHVIALVYKFKESKGRGALPRFAEKLSVEEVIEDEDMTGATKEELVKLMLLHKVATQEATQRCLYALNKFVSAFMQGLGNLEFLKKLKHLMDKNSGLYPSLNLSCQDADGNSLMHLATKCKFSSHALSVVEKLCSWQCPVDLRDHAGHTALDYLKPNDRRAEFLRSATNPTAGAKQKKTVFTEKIDTESNANKLREKAMDMLSRLPDVIVNYIDDEQEDMKEDEEEEEEGDEEVKEEEDEVDDEDADDQVYSVSEDEADQEESKQEDEDSDDLDIDAKVFDDLLWDVECTEAVWNLLKGSSSDASEKPGKGRKKERISYGMKKIVVSKIKQLASGDWRPHLQRKIHGIPETLALHRVQLPGGACILWELAVAFSPQKSQGSAEAQASGDNPQTATGGGRIYSEIIRVWSVVLHHSDLQRKVKWIVGSHKRGKDCLVQKKLKGLPSSQFAGTSSSSRNPVLYMEHEVCDQRRSASQKEASANRQRNLCPPASAQRNEFQILKFYSFSSALVAAILSNSTRKIDFPFRVTDLEYEMIHLESATPVLLLGRSGTGKTTCCLYRLWAKFLCYWEKALELGEPWLPYRNPALDLLDDDDNEEDDVEEASQSSQAKAKTAPPRKEREESHSCSDSESAVCELESEDDEEDTDTDSTADEEEEEDEGELKSSGPRQEVFSHLHQLFVTKNPKLCSEVEKNFLKLRHASGTLTDHNGVELEPLPNTLQDVEDLAFPLFLTSRQLLLMLDASVKGDAFFARDEELNLKYIIPGWGTQEDIFSIDPLGPNWLDSDDDDDDDDDDNKDGQVKGATAGGRKVKGITEESHHQFGEQRKRKTYLRRECTFEVFANEVWPKISKKAKVDCHPSLVWTEIMSFIQGSFEALSSDGGFLSYEDYLTIGRKRAPNFSGDRSKVYAAFEKYRKQKQDNHLFDESDLVFNIYRRLRKMNYYQPWILHEIYVDETQDFTQAELALLMCVCQDPNKMFLAGDTAQAIMRGISFRFKDLSSLFHFAAESVPEKVHQLRYNYRSHCEILSLASSVLDILHKFFPESFDWLHRDQGMFPGPKPVVIESCSSEDLALLLSGNQRVSSHIEFGAHQAILVTNEESKNQLPEVLSAGLVLTIYEAKGLEFDDVLLYNFFADSPASKEWRVVTEYLDELAAQTSGPGDKTLVEIDSGILKMPDRPRPLAFDSDQHKLLSSELKHLYTAITRARVNVWIFDKDPGSRGPMFEYFKARKLVQCMGAKEEPLSENFIFAQKSSAQQWRKSGDKFMSQKQFALAAKCFKHAGHKDREKLALAYLSATEASGLRSKPTQMRRQYLKAGAQFVWCGDLRRAALCFQNAREHKLSALAFEKHGELETASKQYLFVPSPQEASRCLEQTGMFRKAIAVLEDSHFYDRAIDCLHRYQIKVERLSAERGDVPKVLVDNKPKESQSEDDLCHRAANYHHQNKDFDRAEAAIIRLKNSSDQIVFLEKNGYWEKAAELFREEGNTEKAAALMLKAGKLDRALTFAKDGFHKPLEASIYLASSRRNHSEEVANQVNNANPTAF